MPQNVRIHPQRELISLWLGWRGKSPLSEAERQQLLADAERWIAGLKQFLHP